MTNSSTVVIQVSQYRDLHATLLEACGGVIDVLSLAGVNVEECLSNILRQFVEVIHHVVQCGDALVLAATSLCSGEDLCDMVTRFPPMEKPK